MGIGDGKKSFHEGEESEDRPYSIELPALKLAEILYARLLPTLGNVSGAAHDRHLRYGTQFLSKGKPERHLPLQPPVTRTFSNINAEFIYIAPQSLTHLKDIDPARIARPSSPANPIKDISTNAKNA